MNTAVMFSSKTDDWATPQEFFDDLNREFGFTLDPCADDHNHKCAKYYTRAQDGLSQDWGGNVFFVILRMAKKSGIGFVSLWKKARNRIPLLSCSFLREPIQSTSTSTYTEKRRSDLSVAVLNSAGKRTQPRSRRWS